ncbi:tRNA (adenosine(37)-N6)-threonylcarbamoyltransferase complex ATPase subunit type 1 TsaE [Cohaesibacter intestini]|uniref:tRNA (adenosine(37)-N6)-threonylcarbamoyltransferase complex ATPase subunit type 1 TsaE n=1 Tax=Cohaesibacter intestini TaxID=2211145 RepID=UPI000DEB2230|nr:tRNA (adenosine(37)-N6)-threonylcarbamoyltransferase complex ATPase subunit type 1 TsaE [Cohaesibacter intestini]
MSDPTCPSSERNETVWSFCFASLDEAASVALAFDLAGVIGTGDCLALDGSVGLGKSTFARALLRGRAEDPALEVPSPTFTLVQTYDMPSDQEDQESLEISHFDLYRIGDFDELYEIGLEESWLQGVALIEWPDRAEELLPEDALWLQFEPGADDDRRKLTLSGTGAWGNRLQRLCLKRALLIASGWGGGMITPIKGDLSPRSYGRVSLSDQASQDSFEVDNAGAQKHAILMDMPAWPPGPILADGRAYDLVAHRVTALAPMVSISEGLTDLGLRVPNIHGVDLTNGLMLWEDLGGVTLADGPESPVAERYIATARQLAHLHSQPCPTAFDGTGGTHHLSRYDRAAFLVELDVFLDHYWPHVKGRACPQEERARFAALWAPLLNRLERAEQVLVLRDVQDPNCFWLRDAPDGQPVGFIDFQDCLIGPVAYDLAALATDARVTISDRLEEDILSAYHSARDITGESREGFAVLYCLCVAQRTMKNLGAFARAADQWNRPSYLAHIPRSLGYLRKALAHPRLSDLKDWYDSHQLDG